jgi:YfiH family protein
VTDDLHIAVDLGAARGVFTTRRGGVSTGPYASLNLGRMTEDDPEAVDENRRRLPVQWTRVAFGRQVHGADVHRADGPGWTDAVDGQATGEPGTAGLVMTADCLPVLLAAEGAVAAVHAGWRGVAAGVLEEGVQALRDVGGTGPVLVALGPCARACCYEVGEEVHAAIPGARVGERNLDLAGAAHKRLAAAGVDAVMDTGHCTMCSDPALFFSHRRDGGVTGRQAGIVWQK